MINKLQQSKWHYMSTFKSNSDGSLVLTYNGMTLGTSLCLLCLFLQNEGENHRGVLYFSESYISRGFYLDTETQSRH
jgi:hypothetical protein